MQSFQKLLRSALLSDCLTWCSNHLNPASPFPQLACNVKSPDQRLDSIPNTAMLSITVSGPRICRRKRCPSSAHARGPTHTYKSYKNFLLHSSSPATSCLFYVFTLCFYFSFSSSNLNLLSPTHFTPFISLRSALALLQSTISTMVDKTGGGGGSQNANGSSNHRRARACACGILPTGLDLILLGEKRGLIV